MFHLFARLIRSDFSSYSPDRWADLPPKARSPAHPGLGNSMTFGLGPHSCLGYKFTIAEIKVFLAAIMPHFVFTPAEGVEITKFNSILTRPYIRNKSELGSGLPIVVGKYTG
jgi:cytochrome P450